MAKVLMDRLVITAYGNVEVEILQQFKRVVGARNFKKAIWPYIVEIAKQSKFPKKTYRD
jgi:hypothetical protein